MTPERLWQIKPLLESALDLDSSLRHAYLDRACGGDEALRRDIEAVIAAQSSADRIFDRPAVETILEMLAASPASPPPANAFDPAAVETASEIADARNLAQTQSTREPFLLQPGVEIGGRYLIERELDRGGFGSVLLGRDSKMYDAQVVIKVLRDLGQDDQPSWREKKFRQEARALSRMSHPDIVRALDVGDLPDGRPYIVLEYVRGESLRAAITRHGMDLARAGKLLHQIADALSAAHEQGVIHRDLKPENIMLQTGGDEERIKLIDFGIASVREQSVSPVSEQTVAAGTINYMAPEQLIGKPKAASDIYALGVIAYEMVTGRRPFNPDSAFQLPDLQRAGVKVMPCDLRESLPPPAQDAILKALSYNPADRYATARKFSEAFDRALAEDSGIRPPATSRSRAPSSRQTARDHSRPRLMRFWLLIAALLIPLTISLFVWRQLSHQPPKVLPERQLIYWLSFRKNPEKHPHYPIERVIRTPIEQYDQVRLHVNGPPGSLYIINEGPMPDQEQSSYYFLFPYSMNKDFPAKLRPNQPFQIPLPTDDDDPENDWFSLNSQAGMEKYWLIWSEKPVRELEDVAEHVDHTGRSEISDPTYIRLVRQRLSEYSINKSESEEDDVNKQVILKARGDTLVGLIELKYR